MINQIQNYIVLSVFSKYICIYYLTIKNHLKIKNCNL